MLSVLLEVLIKLSDTSQLPPVRSKEDGSIVPTTAMTKVEICMSVFLYTMSIADSGVRLHRDGGVRREPCLGIDKQNVYKLT